MSSQGACIRQGSKPCHSFRWNNTKFCIYLQGDFVTAYSGKHVFPTLGENILTYEDRVYTSGLAQCNHEEADPLIMIHVLHASLHYHRRIKIGTLTLLSLLFSLMQLSN